MVLWGFLPVPLQVAWPLGGEPCLRWLLPSTLPRWAARLNADAAVSEPLAPELWQVRRTGRTSVPHNQAENRERLRFGVNGSEPPRTVL